MALPIPFRKGFEPEVQLPPGQFQASFAIWSKIRVLLATITSNVPEALILAQRETIAWVKAKRYGDGRI
jgi:hypothetical protein